MLDYVKIGVIAIASLANFFIGAIVFKNNSKNRINVVFLLIATSLGLWGFSLLFYQFPIIFSSFFWIKATYLAASIYVVLILSFSFIFPSPIYRRAWVWGGIFSAIFLTITAWLLYFTNFWIVRVVIDPQKGLQTIWGKGYFLWLGLLWIIMIWIFVNFIIKWRRSLGSQRLQLQYFFLSFIILAISVQVPDVIIPIFFHTTRYFFISALVSFIFSGAVAYSIVRHRLMGIRMVVARSISYSVLVLALGIICSSGLFLVEVFTPSELIPKTNIFISTILVLLISFVFQPLRSFFEKVTNGIFYRHHYDENRLLYDLTLTMSSSLRLNEMNGKLLKKIIGEMHISRGAIVLINHGRIFNLSHAGYKRPPKFSAEDLAELTGRREVVVFDELEESRLKRALRRLGIQVIVPLRTQKKRDNILILGEKLSGDPYTDQDIRLLEVFAPAAAVAISNTISVEQLIQLDELKSEFIAVASHQLRTPLSVARWNFELVLEGAFGHLSPKIRGIVSDTYRALMDLNQGLNNLMIALEIEERKVNMKYDQVDFNKDVLGEALASLKKEIVAKDIKISKKIIFKGLIRLDRHKMVETLKALITNSIEYSPAGSKVEIFVQAIEEDGRRKLFFSIKDQGIGVSLKNQAFIFKKFFRGEEAKELSPNGFGLSLFIARSFIEFHGGRIWLEKGDGKELGATFVFTLPL